MMRKSIACLFCVIAAGVPLRATQDFERSYALVPGRHIVINNIMGDIKVAGYKGKEIKVIARKEGPDKDSINIVDKSFGPRIELFPTRSKFSSNKSKVNFEVKVPETEKPVVIELKSGTGRIEVVDLSGSLVANSFRGDIKVSNVKGNVYAHSISGDMNAEITQSQGRRWMKFNSTSGNIKVTVPSNFEARVQMSTSKDITVDFPINISRGRYGGQIARGKLGAGTQMIEITSVFGSVSLMKN